MYEKAVDILIVEDNPNDVELTIKALEKNFNCSIKVVRDGEEALNFFFAGKEHPHRESGFCRFVILDLKLPKIDGFEVLEKLKTTNRTSKIPVIVFSSSGEDRDIKRCFELGVNSYLVKPVDYREFVDCVQELGHYWLRLNQDSKH